MSSEALTAVAEELDVVASWFIGPRQQRVVRLAEAVRALADGQQVDPAQITVSRASTAPPPPAGDDYDEPHLDQG